MVTLTLATRPVLMSETITGETSRGVRQRPVNSYHRRPIRFTFGFFRSPMFHWADNRSLWDMYHLSIAGFLAIAFYFFTVLKEANKDYPYATEAMVFFLLLVMGEGDRPGIIDLHGMRAALLSLAAMSVRPANFPDVRANTAAVVKAQSKRLQLPTSSQVHESLALHPLRCETVPGRRLYSSAKPSTPWNK